jgi:peptidylprolyl isomerase
VSRRLRRLPLLLIPALLATTLVACGSDSGSSGSDSSGSDESLHGIVITGDVGTAPEVEWNGELETDKTETTVVTEGDGAEIAEGDQIQANLWVGNGTTQADAYSTYDEGGTAETITASADLSPVFKDAVLGQKIGSRVAVTTTAAEAFGEAGNPNMGIGNKDTVLIIVDLMEEYQPPTPKDVPASEMPTVVEEKGKPVSLDFTGIAEPKADDELKRTVIKEGDGEEVTTDMTVKVNYLGMTYDAKKPFDESYSKEPVEFALTGVVQGWTYGLEGVKVGSRVLLAIPPALGYGAQEQANIPANSTLYFVVDVISAK